MAVVYATTVFYKPKCFILIKFGLDIKVNAFFQAEVNVTSNKHLSLRSWDLLKE